jgi:AcrR family transcriptional regulator
MSDKYTAKQKQILEQGKKLFWKFGFRRVSIEEICREAGVSKMTFYKYFPNKTELAMSVMNIEFEQGIRRIREVGKEHVSTEATLKRIMEMKFEGTVGIGEEFMKELYTHAEGPLKDYMEKKTVEVFNEVVLLYERGKKDGWIRKDLNIPFMIHFTRKAIDVISSEEVPPYFENPQEMVMEITRLFIYGIAPHD